MDKRGSCRQSECTRGLRKGELVGRGWAWGIESNPSGRPDPPPERQQRQLDPPGKVDDDLANSKYRPDATCPRCNGAGELPEFRHIQDGVCFLCWGTGRVTAGQRDAFRAAGSTSSAGPEDLAYQLEVADMIRFGMEFGPEAFGLLEKLRDREFDRYRKALQSIRNGRAVDVARALEQWWEDA